LEFWKLSWRDSEDKQKNHHLLTRASKLCFLHKAPSLTSPRCDGWWVHAEGRIETRASEERRKENSMRHYAAARKRERKEAKKMLMEDNNSNNSNKMMKTTATTKKSKKKKEIDVIDNVKYFSCIKDALLSRLDSKERAIWQTKKISSQFSNLLLLSRSKFVEEKYRRRWKAI
jgi:molecular chaperone GrpE (heat shock protein)